ncbi:MAG: RIP metalloprotease RseP [Gemmatimonadetes bacterium]|nr:RIP metalloprotease RseP [Gemmatimonadota bacterium]
MQTLLLTVLVLAVLVFVHELGHFVAAKWAGIAVPRFSIGLGPRVVGFRFGETDYCLSAIPFGGYVKMAGMEGEEAFESLEGGPEHEDDEEAELERGVPPERRFESKSRWWRLAVLSAGVAMNFALGWVIYVGLAWSEGIPTIDGTTVAGVDSAALAEYPALQALPSGATIVAVGGEPVENWYELTQGIADGQGPLTLGLESGETVEVPVAEDERGALAVSIQPLVPPRIAEVESGSPADRAGLRPGDRIVSVDGVEIVSFGDISGIVRERPNQVVPVTVVRSADGQERTVSLTVRVGSQKAPRTTDGKFVDTGYLGVGTDIGRVELSPVGALVTGTRASIRAGTLIVDGLYQLVTGRVSMRSLGGPVAIGQLTGHFARQGASSLFAWVALFSINLAILNLLPIPVLDGGHIFFLGIEAARGRPLSMKQKMRWSQVGLAFLVLLMAWAFTADILRLVGF